MVHSVPRKILITVDVEDWFQVENLRPWIPPDKWDRCTVRVVENTRRLLDLFDRSLPVNVQATFFILGWVAEKTPELVREISLRGHEVASHGYGHMMCNLIESRELKEDLKRSKFLLEDTIGKEVKGYRAPNFSISDQTLDLVRSAGYRYDSSYNSFSGNDRYGRISVDGAERKGIVIRLAQEFAELPISNLILRGQILPWGGGGYFRFLPLTIFRTGVKNILKNTDAYLFYLHPWEIDPDQPRVKQAKGFSRWRHYLNLDKTHSRLARLIAYFSDCDFVTCSQYIESKLA